MIYLKEFSTENDYLAYRDDKSNYLKPNVSLCEGNSTVYYNYPPKPKANGHDYVDLGLPNGTLWATCNVGASKPSDVGLYFQWGDTSGYTADQIGKDKQFNWNNYKFSIDGSSSNFSKYNKTDNKNVLDLEDDAAHVNMGGDWHMPTPDQIRELINNTTSKWVTQDGVNGRLFISKNGKSIFIPAAGSAWGGSLDGSGSGGGVWSAALYTYDVHGGQGLGVDPSNANLSSYGRYGGFSVRGVLG